MLNTEEESLLSYTYQNFEAYVKNYQCFSLTSRKEYLLDFVGLNMKNYQAYGRRNHTLTHQIF